MKDQLKEATTVTIRSNNVKLSGKKPEISNKVRDLNEGREKIEDRYNYLIDHLPDPLPADFGHDV